MTTHQRSGDGRRAVVRLLRPALVAAVVGLAVLCGTGVAAADTGPLDPPPVASAPTGVAAPGPGPVNPPPVGPNRRGEITPTLDCVVRNGSADYTAVLGYTSTYLSTVTIPIGKDNNLTVSPDAPQPTSFQPGTHHGVLSIQVTTPTASWTLDGNTLLVTASGADSCSAGVVMPATGNGTGLAIGLAVAGVIGALVVRRWRRRALPSSQPDPSIGARSSGVPAPQPPTASMRGRHRAGSPALPPEGTAVEASASGPPASVLVGSGSRSS